MQYSLNIDLFLESEADFPSCDGTKFSCKETQTELPDLPDFASQCEKTPPACPVTQPLREESPPTCPIEQPRREETPPTCSVAQPRRSQLTNGHNITGSTQADYKSIFR